MVYFIEFKQPISGTEFKQPISGDPEIPAILSAFVVPREAYVKPLCPNGFYLNYLKCLPENTDWPLCEHIFTSYSLTYQTPHRACFKGIGSFQNMIQNISESDIVTNEVLIYESYDVADGNLPVRATLEEVIGNFTEVFDPKSCTERSITLTQSCLVIGNDFPNCNVTYKGDPELFQPVRVDGMDLVYFNNTYVTPIEWKNLTIYSRDLDNIDKFILTREFHLCGRNQLVMDCPSLMVRTIQQSKIDNITFLIYQGTYVHPNEYALYPNGSARICWTSPSLVARDENFFFSTLSRAQIITGHIAFGVSTFSLLATLVTYCTFETLRNIQGLSVMNFIIALLRAQVLLEYPATYLSTWPTLCQTVAVLAHFFFLSSFSWMTVLAWNLFQTFACSNLQTPRNSGMKTTLLLYTIAGWLLPLVYVASCVLVHFWESKVIPLTYGGRDCWIHPFVTNIIAFLLPLALSLLCNILFFMLTIKGVRASRRDTTILARKRKKEIKQEILVYAKVSDKRTIYISCLYLPYKVILM